MPWFLFALAGCATLVWSSRPGRSRVRVTGLAVAAVFFAVAVACWPGRFEVDRMLTELALPLGILWSTLLASVVWYVRQGKVRAAIWAGAMFVGLSAAGNHWIAQGLVVPLERHYFGIDPLEQGRFDAICLLGGGTWLDRNGRVKLTNAGDRVAVAAQLYRAGRTETLFCTGGDLRPAANLPTVAEMSAEALVGLGVPREAIVLGGADNTKTEMQAIRRITDERNWKRVGVVTSAWHMGRVERLAKEAGVSLIPLPADFLSGPIDDLTVRDRFRRFSLIPNAGAVVRIHAASKEYLARLVNR
ncbi:MAG: YdcF family protein [Planctomycetaceae bacterium]|nr:YdcF family protein [Planctomycetaceae bacterium]